jgi:hypothetical protein
MISTNPDTYDMNGGDDIGVATHYKQSAELAGGAGFTFADAVATVFLTALLDEGHAPGITDAQVTRVALEQRNFGEPLDDLVADFKTLGGGKPRLRLQTKRDLIISAAVSNKDFRAVVRDGWATLHLPHFQRDIDRYGAAVGEIAKDKARDLQYLCELARESQTPEHFAARFAPGGNASAALSAIKADIEALLAECKGAACNDAEVHAFLRHFVLLQFDFLHEGAVDPPELINRLRQCLVSSDAAQASALWSVLRQMARDSAGKSGEYFRPRLVRALSNQFKLRMSPLLRGDLAKITSLAHDWLADIAEDVGGVSLDRPTLAAELDAALARGRFIQIRGLPGNGKSVLLRKKIEAELQRGPVLFLKSDRLEGKGWSSFAAAIGLSPAPLAALLAEIASAGSSVLFIDGIDRIETAQQGIVLDVVRTILKDPALDNWKIIVSLRDTGLEPLRNWLGEVLGSTKLAFIQVRELDDDEAEALAEGKPHLRPLLFGPSQVKDIVRRPFFARILHESFATASDPPFTPRSEVDLVANWWTRGGYNAAGQDALNRQRALVELGGNRARSLSQPLRLAELTAPTIQLVAAFVQDGILQWVRDGHTLRFSHDIFFEWAFLHTLMDAGAGWLDEIRACGEPPAVARVVELLSQAHFTDAAGWANNLHAVAGSKARSQWTRAWLLGPLASSVFTANAETFAAAVKADDYRLLQKALVWFQAEKTTPNQNILAGDLPADKRIRFADLLGWPSDYAAWRQLIDFCLERIADIPVALYPDIVAVFEVWQNALAGLRNRVSRALLTQCAAWLKELDARDELAWEDRSRWAALDEAGDFKKSLARLLLRAVGSYPQFAEEYLRRLIAEERLRDEVFKEVIDYSPTLAPIMPALLADLALKHLLQELPADRVARERSERQRAAEHRKAILAKPESERTRHEEMALQGSFISIGGGFSHHDWDSLSVDRASQYYWPPSPLREPFHSLFRHAPDEALRLLNGVANHATLAWRQLHNFHHERRGTPIPVDVAFPWGQQRFWGGAREYLWSRGVWAPHALAAGYLALEEWCFAERDKGTPVDELVQKIVAGNESIAVLGTAAALALESETVSETVFSLLPVQRLWWADKNRFGHDLSGGMAGLIGFDGRHDQTHIEAIKRANARVARKRQLAWLAPHYVFVGTFSERAKEAILRFSKDLPFEYEEQRGNNSIVAQLTEQAAEWEELADPANYAARPHGNDAVEEPKMVEIVHVSPSAAKPENVTKLQKATESLQEGNLWTWAEKTFEQGELEDEKMLDAALALARKLDRRDLFKKADPDETGGMRRGAIAAAAAVALRFRAGRSEADLAWARETLKRAASAPEHRGQFWMPESQLPWHPSIYAARGIAADIRHRTPDAAWPELLLALAAHPLECVSLVAVREALALWDADPRLAWTALYVALSLCHLEPTGTYSHGEPYHSDSYVRKLLAKATKNYRKGKDWPELPSPPPAWAKRAPVKGKSSAVPDFIDDYDYDDTPGATEWTRPSTYWRSKYAEQVLDQVPFAIAMKSAAGPALLNFIERALDWTIAKLCPPWLDAKQQRRHRSTEDYEWKHGVGGIIGHLAGVLPADPAKQLIKPILALEGDPCWSLLAPFASAIVCRYVYDAPAVPSGVPDILKECLEKFLAAPEFRGDSYRAGELHGFELPRLAKTLMFVSVERAALAARFVNGDWSEIVLILPLVDRYIRAAGWASTVMGAFLTLCERSGASYPPEAFADQVLSILDGRDKIPLRGWRGTFLAARIASLVQRAATRETPMPASLGQKLLRILDVLVDMGDRRSAALQLSETFREVRLP